MFSTIGTALLDNIVAQASGKGNKPIEEISFETNQEKSTIDPYLVGTAITILAVLGVTGFFLTKKG